MDRFVLMLEGDGDDQYITEQTLSELDIDVTVKFYPIALNFLIFFHPQINPY